MKILPESDGTEEEGKREKFVCVHVLMTFVALLQPVFDFFNMLINLVTFQLSSSEIELTPEISWQ